VNRVPHRIVGVLVALVMATGAQANTIVIDFDAATPGGLFTVLYFEDGFTMTRISGHYDIWPSGGTGNTQYLGLDQLGLTNSQVEFTGGIFNMVSLDVLYAPAISLGEFQSITSSAGGSQSLATTGIQNFSGSAWQNLTWLRLTTNINIGGPGYDSITFNTVVPIPPAAWLFGSALGLMGVMRRKISS